MMHIDIWNMKFFSLAFYMSLWVRTFGQGNTRYGYSFSFCLFKEVIMKKRKRLMNKMRPTTDQFGRSVFLRLV
ncbi:hypothetical protein BO86DRAFT_32088 [Aspergillus japonicus CBS 114.51]|uniref:Secreted protein n=1 Tax=Aspergillus japonicus CBS 114.51 TaxID=1448312 RepID=A0A8T8X6V2_ASPJA|nr:hypothetical protein BO86DRAFT_32088 [Aspergillus japonicus CBS 114.51]RAH83700.1 hypothetical protein BO86DRAFT_32088 [Aspergillus japonicus CBS 114.51]